MNEFIRLIFPPDYHARYGVMTSRHEKIVPLGFYNNDQLKIFVTRGVTIEQVNDAVVKSDAISGSAVTRGVTIEQVNDAANEDADITKPIDHKKPTIAKPADRLEEVMDAIKSMSIKPKNRTRDGRPKIGPLSKIVGRPVNTQERDRAYAALKKQEGGTSDGL